MRRLEQTGLAALSRAAEGAFLVAEQLAFQQRLGKRRAVDRHEGAMRAAAGVMDALGQQLLAGAAFAGDEDGRIGQRIALGQAQQLAIGQTVAADLLQPVLGGEGTRAPRGADALVGALHRRGVLAGQHHARALAILEDRQQVADDHMGAQTDDPVLLADAVAQRVLQVQLRTKLLQRTTKRGARWQVQQQRQRRVERLHDALVVHGRDTGRNVLQHAVQVPALGDFNALAMENAERFFQGLAHGVGTQRKHAAQAGLLGQLHDRRGTDDAAGSPFGHLFYRQPCLIQCGVAGLMNLHGEQRSHGLQIGIDAVVADDRHLRGMCPRLVQSAQQVSAADTHRQYRAGQMLAQVGGGGSGADENVDLALPLQRARDLQRFVHRGVENPDAGFIGIVRH